MSKIASFFKDVYEQNDWGDDESRSGVGSSLAATEKLRTDLPVLLRYLKIKSLLDAPCGDFNWMNEVDLGEVTYIGGDIVEEVVARNRERYARPDRQFQVVDLINDDLPAADAVMCRDCLIHFNEDLALAALKNLARSDSRFLLLTTFERLGGWESLGWVNAELDHEPGLQVSYRFRPINLRLPPFSLPPPLHLIYETGASVHDKALGVWSTEDVRQALAANDPVA